MRWLLTLSILCVAQTAYAGDVATFDSFYDKSFFSIWMILIAAAVAVAAAAFVFFTGGTGSPAVVAVGTWIGNMAGLSGAAATSYGLALIGGGAVACGGLGIAGGTAILTAAFVFSTEVVVTVAVDGVANEYSKDRFVEDSKNLLLIPLPRESDGPKEFKKAFKLLKKVNDEEGLNSELNQQVMKEALNDLEAAKLSSYDSEDRIRVQLLRSILYFNTYNYDEALRHAGYTIKQCKRIDEISSLPSFVYSCAAAYSESLDLNRVTWNYFRPAILEEQKNDLIPYMFACYAERIFYRMHDGSTDWKTIQSLANISMGGLREEYSAQIAPLLLSKIIVQLKIEQQTIYGLCQSDNELIEKHPNTLARVNRAYDSYKGLLSVSSSLFEGLLVGTLSTDEKSKSGFADLHKLTEDYRIDSINLHEEIKRLESIQNNPQQPEMVKASETGSSGINFFWTIMSITGILAALYITYNKLRLKYTKL